jgi:lysosomal alpha-glucosidase
MKNVYTFVYFKKRMHDADFPYDVQWTDIDAMSDHLDFTYDKNRFNGLPDLVRSLQAGGQHYVNIIDPAISSSQPSGSYPAFDEGIKQNVFIKKYNSNDPIIGKVRSLLICVDTDIFCFTFEGLARCNCIS